jgi:general secretion pathway protein F/type IV pilus assembly protein PilC
MIFKYTGIDKTGKKVKGRIESKAPEFAKRNLKNQGIFVESLKEVGNSFSFLTKLQNLRMSEIDPKKLSILSRNLSIYLNSSIPIVKAITLAKSQADTKTADFLTSIETMLDQGKSFYTALETQKVYKLPDFYKQSIKIAEENGVLGVVLQELSTFLADQTRLTKQISKAMVYPMFIISISVLMISVMLTVVVPEITSMFVQMKQEIPALTQHVIDLSDFLGKYWILLASIILGLIFTFNLMMRISENFKYSVHMIMLKTPFLGRVVQTSELTRFSYIASTLIKSGVTFVHTIKLAGNTLRNSVLKQKMMKASKLVVEGKKFSQALVKDNSAFKLDKSFIQAIALGEETSETGTILDNLASLYQEENEDSISMFLSLLEPLLMLFVGSAIGVIVTAMLLPIFSLNLNSM